MPVRITYVSTLALLIMVVTASTGCSIFPKVGEKALPTNDVPVDSQAKYFVEMHPTLGKATIFEGQISKPTTIQDALNESGAIKSFSNMSVDLQRRLPNGSALKLPVEFKKNKQVKYEQDYALHPNDRIIVRAKSSSPMDKFIDQVFGDL